MKTITKDEFLKLGTFEQVDYINECAKEYSLGEWLYIKGGKIYDTDDSTHTPIENLFDYALDMHYEATDLQGKLFVD